MYSERVWGCDGDGNAGMWDGEGVVAVSAGWSVWMLHVVHVLCLVQTTC